MTNWDLLTNWNQVERTAKILRVKPTVEKSGVIAFTSPEGIRYELFDLLERQARLIFALLVWVTLISAVTAVLVLNAL